MESSFVPEIDLSSGFFLHDFHILYVCLCLFDTIFTILHPLPMAAPIYFHIRIFICKLSRRQTGTARKHIQFNDHNPNSSRLECKRTDKCFGFCLFFPSYK